RLLGALCGVLLLSIFAFRYLDWQSAPELPPPPAGEALVIEEVIITQQSTRPPPPPRPRLGPPEIAEDPIINDELDLPDFDLDSEFIDTEPPAIGEPEGDMKIVKNPERPPQVRRIVEAVTPPEAAGLSRRVEVRVRLLVNEEGRVEEVIILQIALISENGSREVVPEIGYGILEEVTRAARGWIFAPARQDGEPVASYSEHRFTF
ncbi:MAG: energy transducer TonB, partial [Cyclonatronaceae bacterium]